MEKPIEQKDTNLFSIEDAILSLKRPLVFYGVSVVLINLILLVAGIYVNNKDAEPKKFSNFEACYYGMEQIINNDPSSDLINESVINDLKKTTFKVDQIHLVKVISSFTCDVFTKDSKGVRRYQISLEKNSKFTHLYRILDVKGKKIDSRYQI